MPPDFPPIFLLSTHLQPDELDRLEDSIPSLTYNIREAHVVLGNISRRQRAQFELRRLQLETVPVLDAGPVAPSQDAAQVRASSRYVDEYRGPADVVKVLKLSWLTDCLQEGTLLPLDEYLLYQGRKVPCTPTRNKQPRAPPALAHESTSEHEGPLPPVPEYLHTIYSCQRPTPLDPPNMAFIQELGSIRTLRLLQGDHIGVRAYSTSMATLAAYPHALQSPRGVARLPGCGAKIAELYQQWQVAGQTRETAEAASDPKMAVLDIFYGIWGVGDTAAREFYARGWRDLDDVVEYGWASLSRVQQIGVKFHDEFQLQVSRREVEAIAEVILSHARKVDGGIDMTIVGGYRRGKQESGDVDVVLSHRDESKTLYLVDKVVLSLERSGFITHTLSLWTGNSERGQVPLPWKGEAASGHGTGFDTLDKAMVVWRDPGRRLREGQGQGQSATHRRVDIIGSAWKTVGCALLGWSGGTTFQRDLRRYCEREKGLKFDSSGVRRRADGEWVDLEGRGAGPAPDMETAERRVFAGLGLPWRPPEERCTG